MFYMDLEIRINFMKLKKRKEEFNMFHAMIFLIKKSTYKKFKVKCMILNLLKY